MKWYYLVYTRPDGSETTAWEGAPVRLQEAKKAKAFMDKNIACAVNPPIISVRIVKSAMSDN